MNRNDMYTLCYRLQMEGIGYYFSRNDNNDVIIGFNRWGVWHEVKFSSKTRNILEVIC